MALYLGVDFGTRTIEIYQKDKGIVLREPNIAAVDGGGNVVAVGSEASLIRARAPGTVTIRRPIVNGEITDFNLTAEVLDRFFETVAPKQKKHILCAVKYSLGLQSRALLTRALGDCRTGRITLVESALAALKGSAIEEASCENDEYLGDVVCDIGAGSTEVAYIRKGEILRIEAIPFAGEATDTAIVNYVARKYGLAISPAVAREAKHKLSLCGENVEIELSGLDKTTGMPKRRTITTAELLSSCAYQTENVANALGKLLANLPQHGASKSTAESIVLTGGGALLPGIDEYIAKKIGREITLSPEPLDSVANGLGRMLDNYK